MAQAVDANMKAWYNSKSVGEDKYLPIDDTQYTIANEE